MIVVGLLFALIVFLIGLCGLLVTNQNVIKILMSLEIMFLGAGLQFSMISVYVNDITGQLFALYILVIAACEVAVGLALFVVLARKHKTVTLSTITTVKLKH